MALLQSFFWKRISSTSTPAFDVGRGKKTCLFCGGEITENRWAELERHYDEATKSLKDKVEKAVTWLEEQKRVIQELYKILPENYYLHFKPEVESINKEMEERRREVLSVLEDILLQVKRKQENLYATPTYEEHTFDLARLDEIYARVETLEKDATECGAKQPQQSIVSTTNCHI